MDKLFQPSRIALWQSPLLSIEKSRSNRVNVPIKKFSPVLAGLLILFSSIATIAQVPYPGGVNAGLKVWLKANEGVTLSSGTVTQWENQSFIDTIADATSTNGPDFIDNGLNHNPVLSFDGVSDHMVISGGILGSETINDAHVYIVSTTIAVSNSTSFLERTGELGGDPRFGLTLPWGNNEVFWDVSCCDVKKGRLAAGNWGGSDWRTLCMDREL